MGFCFEQPFLSCNYVFIFHLMFCPNKIIDLKYCHCRSDGADTGRVSVFICVALFALRQWKGQEKKHPGVSV